MVKLIRTADETRADVYTAQSKWVESHTCLLQTLDIEIDKAIHDGKNEISYPVPEARDAVYLSEYLKILGYKSHIENLESREVTKVTFKW